MYRRNALATRRGSEFGQAVDGSGEQVRLGVLEAIVLRVQRPVLESKGAREIEHRDASAAQNRRKLQARFVRGAEEDGIRLGGRDGVGVRGKDREVEPAAERRGRLGKAPLVVGSAGRAEEADDLRPGMAQEDGGELDAAVSRSPDDRRPEGDHAFAQPPRRARAGPAVIPDCTRARRHPRA